MPRWDPPFWLWQPIVHCRGRGLDGEDRAARGRLGFSEVAATIRENLPCNALNGKVKVDSCSEWLLRLVEQPWVRTCCQAATWLSLGETAGRGRQDREHAKAAGVKAVRVYRLCRAWKAPLEVGADGELYA